MITSLDLLTLHHLMNDLNDWLDGGDDGTNKPLPRLCFSNTFSNFSNLQNTYKVCQSLALNSPIPGKLYTP
jgi:hypothetical protein